MNWKMTITKNDFFTAYNFKTLQDIGKEYEWEDFFKSITKQFNTTWSKDNKIQMTFRKINYIQ